MGTLRSTAPTSPIMIVMFLASAVGAAFAPHVRDGTAQSATSAAHFPGWPATYEAKQLRPLPLGAREEAFAKDFPGRIARFTDGNREIIYRFIAEPTRRLHPAADCFKGSGYAITPLPSRRRPDGTTMGCFRARRSEAELSVCEAVHSDTGKSWPDVSSWYWDAMLGRDRGGWWSVVVAERTESHAP